MITDEDKYYVNDAIIRSITGKPIKCSDSTSVEKLIHQLNIEDKDYEALLKKKQDVDLQLRLDHEYLCNLIALRRYASDIEQGVSDTNSNLCVDNFEETLEDYCRSYM